MPRPLRDTTGSHEDTATAAALFDDTSGTQATLTGDRPRVEYAFERGVPHPIRFYTLTSGDDQDADAQKWTLAGSNDGRRWTVLDERSGETFTWRSQTRPFRLDRPANFSQYRIEFDGGPVRLAEVELLGGAMASPLLAHVEAGAVGRAGETVPVRVTVTNAGDSPQAGEVALSAEPGWTVQPAAIPFGPLAADESQTVTFQVTIAAQAETGTYPVRATATSARATAKSSGTVKVFGVVSGPVEFTPGTAAEEPWLFEDGNSQLNGTVYDGRARFTDNLRYAVYSFPLRDDITGGTLALDIGNQFLVQVSTDRQSWRTVLEETRVIRDLSNRDEDVWRELDLATLAGPGETLYLRIADSQPNDGWGAWLARLRLDPELG